MDYIFNPIKNCFEAFFKLMPFLGKFMNLTIIAVFSIAIAFWIFQMLKYEKKEVPNK